MSHGNCRPTPLAPAVASLSHAAGIGRHIMAGLYFEDFHEGQTFDHALSRTVTEMDNVLFSTL
jgi:acyl dehydratase